MNENQVIYSSVSAQAIAPVVVAAVSGKKVHQLNLYNSIHQHPAMQGVGLQQYKKLIKQLADDQIIDEHLGLVTVH